MYLANTVQHATVNFSLLLTREINTEIVVVTYICINCCNRTIRSIVWWLIESKRFIFSDSRTLDHFGNFE